MSEVRAQRNGHLIIRSRRPYLRPNDPSAGAAIELPWLDAQNRDLVIGDILQGHPSEQ
jgi:hypothetical protein